MLFIRGTGGGGFFGLCAILGCAAQVCLLAAVLCGSPATVCPYTMSTSTPIIKYCIRSCDCCMLLCWFHLLFPKIVMNSVSIWVL